jgi:hypothetical protein
MALNHSAEVEKNSLANIKSTTTWKGKVSKQAYRRGSNCCIQAPSNRKHRIEDHVAPAKCTPLFLIT